MARAISIIIGFVFCVVNVGPTFLNKSLGSEVNFFLPSFHHCGSYSLTNPSDKEILNVYNSSYNIISDFYRNRGTSQILGNGTVVFTLWRLAENDFGMYTLHKGRYLMQEPGCDSYFELRRTFDVQPANTSSTATTVPVVWTQWTQCSVQCGTGVRFRQNNHGNQREQQQCTSEAGCNYAWSSWSPWSACGLVGAGCEKSRHRYCLEGSSSRADYSRCGANEYIQRGACYSEECHSQSSSGYATDVQVKWSYWSDWSSCSKACGNGIRTRSRDCLDMRSNLVPGRCPGEKEENETCHDAECDGKNAHLSKTEPTVELPMSVLIGTGAGVFIVLLLIIIFALLIKLRVRKRRADRKNRRAPDIKLHEAKNGKMSISSVSGTHMYDEINDNEVMSVKENSSGLQRVSVLTVDNTYSCLPPTSASPTVNYANSGFQFPPEGAVNAETSLTGNNTNKRNGPRQMSIDSCGYLMPGSAEERARRKKYVKS